MTNQLEGGKCEFCGRPLVLSTSNRNKGQPTRCVCQQRTYQREYMRKQYADPNSKTSQYGKAYFAKNKDVIQEKRRKRRESPAIEPRFTDTVTNEEFHAKRRERNRKFLEANPGKSSEYSRRHLYGLTPEQFKAMSEEQKGLCYLCGKPMLRPHVDHNHVTGENRKLLCGGCNMAVGIIEADPTWIPRTLQYLHSSDRSLSVENGG